MIEDKLYELIRKAKELDEVPVAALIINNGEIIASAFNMTETNNNVLQHAEILSIVEASKVKDNWRLSDCDLYVSLHPCDMCREVIKQARIREVYYYVPRETLHEDYIRIDNSYSQLFKDELTNFFKEKRDE